jgi:hypothetical protein
MSMQRRFLVRCHVPKSLTPAGVVLSLHGGEQRRPGSETPTSGCMACPFRIGVLQK